MATDATQSTWDAIVVGAGIAGMVTGVRLAELGRRVLVVEKGEDERYPCNARMSGGAFHVAFRDVMDDPDVLFNTINTKTQGFARQSFARAMADDVGTAVTWLKAKGVRFIKVGTDAYRQHTLAPPIMPHGKPGYFEGRGGDVMLRTLGAALAKLGGTFMHGTRARRLLMESGRCGGLEVETAGAIRALRAGSVVICDGGFQGNPALMKEFVTPVPEAIKQRNSGSACGDGLTMAREAGAQLVGMSRIYGHLLWQDALRTDYPTPFPLMDFLCCSGLVVDRSARRFMDEGLGGVYMTNRIAALADPLSATVIFDEVVWDGPGREFIAPANPMLLSAGATLVMAPDLIGLARQLELPAEALAATVAAHNAAVDRGAVGPGELPRTVMQYRAYALRQPPFYAVRLAAGVTYTMGGLAIDGDSRVLDCDERPIPGLYSAGCATGGLEGGELVGYVGGLTKSSVSGYRAANHIARTQGSALLAS